MSICQGRIRTKRKGSKGLWGRRKTEPDELELRLNIYSQSCSGRSSPLLPTRPTPRVPRAYIWTYQKFRRRRRSLAHAPRPSHSPQPPFSSPSNHVRPSIREAPLRPKISSSKETTIQGRCRRPLQERLRGRQEGKEKGQEQCVCQPSF